ncbi:hypothetical protein A3A21_01380 [Candidatus Jorgensenbacteria bacterium RIFCSPLOWO2_01_FULL_45_25b]|uniref:Uncharacterized protein n=1 Tax=Candidatus Jorgensenbacteria bacterium RIFCSPLOWO2_01_FULL_45_25b TaxID=1798471 RepID=A0A1F6BVC6_9BACT|nr:MAG: hypothetical protein A3A21_01380 [Candidatus Jorgensenbacteria bacterium RIFCSPLOWO2_01_FULL_45_25b]
MNKHFVLNSKVRIASQTNGKHHFFGYYGTCPWNKNETKLLVLETDIIDRLPQKNDTARVCVINQETEQEEVIGETKSWNWQQGCMLQWLPPYDEQVVWNAREGEKQGAVMFNVRTKETKKISCSIYSVHPNGIEALSLDFAYLNKVREGYGYAGVAEEDEKEKGIYRINIETGERRLIISLESLKAYKTNSQMNGEVHWVDHLEYNQSGKRFCFFHRCKTKDGRFYERLYSASSDGSELRLLLDTGMVTHVAWKGDNDILTWGREESALVRISAKGGWLKYVLPIYHKLGISKFSKGILRNRIIGDKFLLIDEMSGKWEKIGEGILENGHPSFSPDKKWIITDTYPKKHWRKLILFNPNSRKNIEVGKFYALPKKGDNISGSWDLSGMRCDLHPRWNRSGTAICIDSVHEGARQVYVLDIENIIKNNG